MFNETVQDNKPIQKRKKINRFDSLELAFLNKHAKDFDTIGERADDLGIAWGTYSRMMKNKYCGYDTIEKLRDKMSKQKQAA